MMGISFSKAATLLWAIRNAQERLRQAQLAYPDGDTEGPMIAIATYRASLKALEGHDHAV